MLVGGSGPGLGLGLTAGDGRRVRVMEQEVDKSTSQTLRSSCCSTKSCQLIYHIWPVLLAWYMAAEMHRVLKHAECKNKTKMMTRLSLMFIPSYLCLPQVEKAASWEQRAQSSALDQTLAAAFVYPASSMEYLAIKPLLVREINVKSLSGVELKIRQLISDNVKNQVESAALLSFTAFHPETLKSFWSADNNKTKQAEALQQVCVCVWHQCLTEIFW